MAQDSMLTGFRPPQVTLIASYWVRFSLRTGGGLVALLVVLITGLTVATLFISPVEQLMEASPDLGHEKMEAAAWVKELSESDQLVDAVQWFTGAEEEEAVYLLQKQPALMSVIFLVLLLCYPFIACIAGFNQTAGDIGNRGLRYLLLRTERPNILLGRFLGTIYFSVISTAVLFALLIVYVGFKFRIYPGGQLVGWGAQGFVAAILITLPYIAMCAWFSSLLDSAFAALAVCLVATGMPLVFVKLANALTKGTDLGWLERLLPWGWKYDLLSGDVGTRLLAYGVMLGFTLLFLALALRAIAKRDL